jgi:Putative metal-binding motif
MMSRHTILTLALVTSVGLTVASCDDRAVGVGYQGEPCVTDAECGPGMECVDGVCVPVVVPDCQPNSSLECVCEDGQPGLRHCVNGAWSDCICEDIPCGNGIIDPDEECDGEDLGGVTCADLGYFQGGEPSCVTCIIDPLTCCQDQDRDGYGVGCPLGPDCDDTNPEINPGMPEIPDDGIDNDCDGWVDETGQLDDCAAAPPGETLLQLMTRSIGVPLTAITDLQVDGNQAAYGVYTSWGALVPRIHQTPGDGFLPINCQFVVLSTGPVGATDPEQGDNMDLGIYNAPDPAPPALRDGASINDLIQFSMAMTVPPNVTGFSFDFLFLSVEYPEYVCSDYNDTFYALVTGEPQLGTVLTNITYDDVVPEMSVNSVLFQTPPYLNVNLTGTGYEHPSDYVDCTSDPLANCTPPYPCPQYVGSTTGWLRTTSPATPGATIHLRFSAHDEGDNILDSAVVLDNFQWRYDPNITEPVTLPAP